MADRGEERLGTAGMVSEEPTSRGGTGSHARTVDVAIEGSGVAGASVAAALATAGVGVVVV